MLEEIPKTQLVSSMEVLHGSPEGEKALVDTLIQELPLSEHVLAITMRQGPKENVAELTVTVVGSKRLLQEMLTELLVNDPALRDVVIPATVEAIRQILTKEAQNDKG